MSYKISDFLTDLLNRLHDDTNQVAIKIGFHVSTLVVVAKFGVMGVDFLALRFCWVTFKSIPVVLQYLMSMPCKEDSKKKSHLSAQIIEFTTLI
jgi:hypothetical protein